MSFTVYRHPNGISLNGREYALDGEDGNVLEFDSREDAVQWTNSIAPIEVTDEEIMNEELGLFIEEQGEELGRGHVITLIGDNTSVQIVLPEEDS